MDFPALRQQLFEGIMKTYYEIQDFSALSNTSQSSARPLRPADLVAYQRLAVERPATHIISHLQQAEEARRQQEFAPEDRGVSSVLPDNTYLQTWPSPHSATRPLRNHPVGVLFPLMPFALCDCSPGFALFLSAGFSFCIAALCKRNNTTIKRTNPKTVTPQYIAKGMPRLVSSGFVSSRKLNIGVVRKTCNRVRMVYCQRKMFISYRHERSWQEERRQDGHELHFCPISSGVHHN